MENEMEDRMTDNRNKDYYTPPPTPHSHSGFTRMPLITDFFYQYVSMFQARVKKKLVTSYKNWRKNTL